MDFDVAPMPMAPLAIGGPGDSGESNEDFAAPEPRVKLTRAQKAAVIVRLLIDNGANLPLQNLPEAVQTALTTEMGNLRLIDRDTVAATIAEFAGELDSIGLSFSGGLAGALGVLDGHLSPATLARMRREAGVAAKGDPWERVANLELDQLSEVLELESTEVCAVLLSKLSVGKAAELLGRLPGPRARAISYAISQTEAVSPDVVQRIGLTLCAQFDSKPPTAFADGPVERVAAVLNSSRAATRDDVLEGLDETDALFAAEVRRAIFTFANIPQRVGDRDVPKIIRGIDQAKLVMAFAAANEGANAEARDFILENMSKRMAEALREEIEEAPAPKAKEADDAMGAIVAEIKRLADAGELLLLATDGEDDG